MSRISNIMLAKSKIETYFDNDEKNIYKINDLMNIFINYRSKWNLSYSMNLDRFIAFLLEKSYLEKIDLGSKILYGWKIDNYGDEIAYEIAINLKPRSYISHYSAMFLNNMTEQIPKVIYVTFDRETKLINRTKKLEQSKIDLAFSKEKKAKEITYKFRDYRFVLVNSTSDEKIGVKNIILSSGLIVPVTNVERTLIDIIVRPELSGGVQEIIKAYKSIENIQISKLNTYLKKKSYVYPFEQAIGFCLDYAKVDKNKVDLFLKSCDLEYDFYLDRCIKNPKFSKKWRLYYPTFLLS